MKLSDIIDFLEGIYPLHLQEEWDNSGLILGNPEKNASKALITLDITDEVLREALDKNCNLIISHHPLIFKGIKSLTGRNDTQRLVENAIKSDIAVYCLHTNLDNSPSGINGYLCEKLGLINPITLLPQREILRKLVTFCPLEAADKVRQALFAAGAGHIGNYDSCSFSIHGSGSFRGSDQTNPYVGEKEKLHFENEIRIETVYPVYREAIILGALLKSHPYEEVAYDLYKLENVFAGAGSGMIGEYEEAVSEKEFLNRLKEVFGTKIIRHSRLTSRLVRRVAVCSGSGSFLIDEAIKQGAGFLVTADVKYHDFFKGEGKMVIADVGHHECERFAKDLIHSLLIKKFSTFAVLVSEAGTNSVNYF
jgi:dinuclear metal center YbgI/SA1388 family protein